MDAGRLAALLFSYALLLGVASASIFDSARNKKCQPIEISLCKDIPYNDTFYPNLLGHSDQHSVRFGFLLYYAFDRSLYRLFSVEHAD